MGQCKSSCLGAGFAHWLKLGKLWTTTRFKRMNQGATHDKPLRPSLAGFTEEQMIAALKQHTAGASTKELCRQLGIATETLYNGKRGERGQTAAFHGG